jgi:hypothetical protein
VTASGVIIETLLRYLATQIPVLIALVAAIVMVLVNRAKDPRKATMGVIAFALALVSTVLWPPVVALSSWLTVTQSALVGGIVNGGGDFLLNVLTGAAWLLIVLALFGRKAASDN